jgi:cell wall-associated NlpC family hydrolase
MHSRLACARTRALPLAVLVAATVPACGASAAVHAAASSASAVAAAANWDSTQQRQVVAAGLMDESDGSFDGAGRLSAAQANTAMAALATRLQSATPQGAPTKKSAPGEAGGPAEPNGTDEPGGPGESNGSDEPGLVEPTPSDEKAPGTEQAATAEPDAASVSAAMAPAAPVAHTAQSPVTVATFDGMLVEELGLTAVGAHVQAATATAGLRPPAYFGSEVVARSLELRYEHAVGSQRLDLFPKDPITRAEAAWSLADAMGLSAGSIAGARETLTAFALPRLTAAQRQALQIAVSRIGYPYVWGGTTDNTVDGLEHGGFDCSGFAWRVYKVSGLPWGKQIRGRTAAEQAGEIPRSQRLQASQLEPGDLLFFGSAHLDSKATEKNIIHEGIYLGDNWVIHSSAQGVYVLPLSGSWLGDSFAWGRRVIR